MLVVTGLVEHRTAAGGDPPRRAEILEQVEGGVDGGEGDVRESVGDGGQELVRCDVAVEVA
jgi:hypothetical protein